ncbi:peroxiredoxin [Martelella endophytica]|uniref:thioredoxin-dependent peroxiredoxin n=1 Tax=Martelella endophytica TaxID=1486262 RepID=A0A0D5LXN2_MAREN|nr:peroxiredoxin [Martelella endophytica]AJY48223.1 hypothetical protein TM49_14240 [Martelella endophytica]
MAIPAPGDKAPDFELSLLDGKTFTLADAAGKKLVLYFYPKDNTKGCTTEALDFTRLSGDFEKAGAIVVGISPDSLQSHAKFRDKHELSVLLAADEDHKAAEAFGVWQEKSMYGRKFMGIVRSTFLIGEDGTVIAVWPKVKVAGHAEAVLAALQ